jgi:hypothetical protein
MYKVQNGTWLLFSETVYDADEDAFVENLDADIKLNTGVSDELFRVPGEAQAAAPAVLRTRQSRTRSAARTR